MCGKLNNFRILGARGYAKPHMEIHQTLSFPIPTQKKESSLGTRLPAKCKLEESAAVFQRREATKRKRLCAMQQATQKQQVTGRQQVREQDMSRGDEHVKISH